MPNCDSIPKPFCTLGLCKSNSIITVRFPPLASMAARLIEQNVFPSPGLLEVSKIKPFCLSPNINCRLVRTVLNDSAIADLGS